LKAYLEIITDEVRQAKIGECYLSDRDVMRRDLSSPTNGAYPIVTRHEIPIPEGAKILHYWLDSIVDADVTHINLSRPKKKVTKWLWAVGVEDGDVLFTYQIHRTEDEIKRAYKNGMWYHRIDETEIEVEE
jgi:hypothetical protein